GTQDRGAPLGRRIVGEDVVDLVTAAARGEPWPVGPLPVAALELLFGLAVVDLVLAVVRVAVLGEAEVDQRAVPGVTEGHAEGSFAVQGVFPAYAKSTRTASSRSARWSRPPPRRPRNPARCPSTAGPAHAPARARAGGRSRGGWTR